MKTKKSFKQLLALLLLQMLGLFYFRVEAQACFSTLEKFPKLVQHKSSTGESKINVMQLGSVNQRLFVGGYSKDPLSGFNDGSQVAFIGFIDNQIWKWRQNAFSFPSFSDPTVGSIAVRADESKIAVLFISSSLAAGSDSYVYELDALTGFQTSSTKLKLPSMPLSAPQGMVYLDNTSKTLLIALTKQNATHSKENYIASVDFTKQGQQQVSIIQLTEINQFITHLSASTVSNEFYMASNLLYNFDGSTISGIRFVRYAYDSVSLTFTQRTKILIYNSSFPTTFGSQSPKLTAFRFYKQRNTVCGAIKRYDQSSEDIWLYNWSSTQNTNIDFKTLGTMKTVLDCNPFSSFISFFLVQEVQAGLTSVRIHSIDWTTDPIDITVYPVLNSSSTMSNTASVLMQGNTSYGYFAMQSNNIFSPPNNFSYTTAAIYYSNRNFGSCVSKQDYSVNESYSLGNLQIIVENGSRYTPSISTTQVATITDSGF